MFRAGFIIIFLFYFVTPLIAQKRPFNERISIPSENFIVDESIKKWSLGINTHIAYELLQPRSDYTTLDLMLRKQVGRYSAIRFGVNYSSTLLSRESEFYPRFNNHIIGLSAGYEWQVLLSHRWKWYYGADLGTGRGIYIVDDPRSPELTRSTRDTYSVSLLPFIGIRYNLSPSFFIGTELKLEAEYLFYRHQLNWRTFPGDDTYRREFSVNFRPFTGIFIHYIF